MANDRCGICRRALRGDDKGNKLVRTREMGIAAIRKYVKKESPKAPEVELNGLYHSCKECAAVYTEAAEKWVIKNTPKNKKVPDLKRKHALS
jgi:hypothetical protein